MTVATPTNFARLRLTEKELVPHYTPIVRPCIDRDSLLSFSAWGRQQVTGQSAFERYLNALDITYHREKRTRAKDLRELIQEVIEELDLGSHHGSPKAYGVTFDRTKNTTFDYWLFDELLVQLDAGAGGKGIQKPLNQLRLMAWRKGPAALADVIRRVCRHYPQLNFQRLLVFEVVKGNHKVIRPLRGTYRK
ncbi:hypothetical protein [Georhizobium sp. MAB10]|uniref:hypothetical protein n=1 Tax=Georhizobium sp. MAB10 TaxID=3028319 RepID=UPI003855D6F0